MFVVGVWAFIFCTGHRWRKTKEQQHWNNTKQIFPEQKTKRSFALRRLCPVHEVLSGMRNPLKCGQIVNSFGQGKCTFQKLFLWQPCLNKLMHVENWGTDQLQHDLYVDISYKFTLSWVFVSHACMYTNKCEHFHNWFGTLYSDNSVLMRAASSQNLTHPAWDYTVVC